MDDVVGWLRVAALLRKFVVRVILYVDIYLESKIEFFLSSTTKKIECKNNSVSKEEFRAKTVVWG